MTCGQEEIDLLDSRPAPRRQAPLGVLVEFLLPNANSTRPQIKRGTNKSLRSHQSSVREQLELNGIIARTNTHYRHPPTNQRGRVELKQ